MVVDARHVQLLVLPLLLLSFGLDLLQERHAAPAPAHHHERVGGALRRLIHHSRVLPLHEFLSQDSQDTQTHRQTER